MGIKCHRCGKDTGIMPHWDTRAAWCKECSKVTPKWRMAWHCIKCGYEIAELPSEECPVCGYGKYV